MRVDDGQPVAFLALSFDLVFAFAVTQIAAMLVGLAVVAPLAPVWLLLVVAATLFGIVVVEGAGPEPERAAHLVGAP